MTRLTRLFILLGVICLLSPSPGWGQINVPNIFTPQTRILSSEVNANFAAIATDALNRTGGTMTGTLTAQAIVPDGNGTRDLGLTGTRFATVWATTLTGNGSALTALNASNLTSGTIPDARFPATLPVASGANLTGLNATNIASGTLADGRLSSNVPLKNINETITGQWTFTGSLGATTLSSLLVTGQATFNGVSPSIAVANQIRVTADTSANALVVIGRASDSGSTILFRDSFNTQTFGAIRIDPPSNLMRLEAGAPAVPVLDLTPSGITPFVRINSGSAQPGFLAFNSVTDSLVPNGATVQFDTEVYDETGAFVSNTFTAPVTGRYLLSAGVEVLNTEAGAASDIRIVTTARTYVIGALFATGDRSSQLSGTVIADMSAGHTASVVYTTDGAAVASIWGTSPNPLTTFFTGRLLP